MPDGKTILIVDKPSVCELIKPYLERIGYAVAPCYDKGDVLFKIRDLSPVLLLIGSVQADRDTEQYVRDLRSCTEVPMLLTVDANDAAARAALLDAGADDVMSAPVHTGELRARAKALLRRAAAEVPQHSDVIRYDNFEISQERFELKLRGEKVEIPPKELQLLYCLAASPNRVFSREKLLEHVWDFAFLGDSRTVDVHIKRLREKLTGVSDKWALTTVWGVGYKFELK